MHGEIVIGAESCLRKNNELQNLVGEKHVEELSPYLFGHHFLSSLVHHTPHYGNLVADQPHGLVESVLLNNENDLVVEEVMVDGGRW